MDQQLLNQTFALPPIPWEKKPAGYTVVVWRYNKGPIIPKDIPSQPLLLHGSTH